MNDMSRTELGTREKQKRMEGPSARNINRASDATTLGRLKKLVSDKARHALRTSMQTSALIVSALTLMISSDCGNVPNPFSESQEPPPTPISASKENLPKQTLVIIPHTPNPSPTPHRLPDSPPASFFLKATATALESTGQRNSFREEAGFTKEMFESVRQGTFIITVWGEKEIERKKVRFGMEGTAWLAQSENNTYYVVTNRHVAFPEGVIVTGVNLWRPNIDTEKFVPTIITMATTKDPDGPDIAVLKLQGDYHGTIPVEPIKWEDNVLLQKGDKALIVGFPKEFRRENTELDHLTLGSVISIEKTIPEKGEWYTRGLINVGSSGSPSIINKDGHAIVVGIIFSIANDVLKNSETEIQRQPIGIGRSLKIAYLIDALQAKTD